MIAFVEFVLCVILFEATLRFAQKSDGKRAAVYGIGLVAAAAALLSQMKRYCRQFVLVLTEFWHFCDNLSAMNGWEMAGCRATRFSRLTFLSPCGR